jgi:hypothetical protein
MSAAQTLKHSTFICAPKRRAFSNINNSPIGPTGFEGPCFTDTDFIIDLPVTKDESEAVRNWL